MTARPGVGDDDFQVRKVCAGGDRLITKYDQRLQRLHQLHTDVPVINNMGKLLSLKEQLPRAELDGVLEQF